MADIVAGKRILAADFMSAQTNNSNTAQNNITSTWTAGSPEVGVTFVAPTSGKVQITIGGWIQDNGGTNRGFMSLQLFEDDSSGDEVIAETDSQYRFMVKGTNASDPEAGSRTRVVPGLDPGQTYYARVMVAASAGSTVDFNQRSIDAIGVQ